MTAENANSDLPLRVSALIDYLSPNMPLFQLPLIANALSFHRIAQKHFIKELA
jgi:hypothetical protein